MPFAVPNIAGILILTAFAVPAVTGGVPSVASLRCSCLCPNAAGILAVSGVPTVAGISLFLASLLLLADTSVSDIVMVAGVGTCS